MLANRVGLIKTVSLSTVGINVNDIEINDNEIKTVLLGMVRRQKRGCCECNLGFQVLHSNLMWTVQIKLSYKKRKKGGQRGNTQDDDNN